MRLFGRKGPEDLRREATEHRAAGRSREAAELMGRAIERHDKPPVAWRTELVEMATETGADDAIDRAHRGRLLAQPASVAFVDQWTTVLRSRQGTDAHRVLIELQASSDRPLPAVLLRVLGGDLADEVRTTLADPLATFLAGADVARVRAAWGDYAGLRPIDPDLAAAVSRLPAAVVQLAFLADPPRIVTLAEAADAGLGLSPGAVAWYGEQFLTPDVPASWADPVLVSDYAGERIATDEARVGYQTRAVRERRLLLHDPHSDAPVVPFDNVSIFGRTVYSFGEDRLTLLVAGNFGSSALFLSLADQNVLIDLGADMWQHMLMFRVTNLHAEMLRRVCAQHERYNAVCGRPARLEADRTVVVMGMMVENFAHHLWNCFTGFDRLVEAGLAGQVDQLRVGGSEFFGPLEGVFPELAGAEIVEEPKRGIRDPYPFSDEHLIVSPGGYFIRRALVDRVVDRMAALPPTPGAAAPPVPGEDRPFPIVWFGFRVGSRAWVDQETEVPPIIDAIHRAHPQAVVVLDGFSRPVGRDVASGRWADAMARLGAVADTIIAGVEHSDRVVSMVGNTLRESVLWAAATDVYVAPNGTTQHKVGWFTDGPGISYSSPSLLDLELEKRPGAYESEGRPVPVTVIGAPEEAGELHFAIDTRRHLENVRLDRAEITRILLEMIDSRS